ncbi:MAG: hypothetical protein ACRC8Y_05030 [Chroococcales cyanobacterium]
MSHLTLDARIQHWDAMLAQYTDYPEDFRVKVAIVLAQDDIYGLGARTPKQLAVMEEAVNRRASAPK